MKNKADSHKSRTLVTKNLEKCEKNVSKVAKGIKGDQSDESVLSVDNARNTGSKMLPMDRKTDGLTDRRTVKVTF